MQLPRRLGALARNVAALILIGGTAPASAQMPGGYGGIPSLPGGFNLDELPPDIQRQLRSQGGDTAAPTLQPQERQQRTIGAPTQPVEPSLLEEQYSRRAGRPLEQIGYGIFAGEEGATFREVGAVQDGYILGIGDQLVVHMRGRISQSVTVEVNREGTVVLPELPPIPAAGSTFGDFRRALRQEAGQRMLGTEVFVSVGRIREIAITMTGEVRNPGVVTVSGLASLVDALRLAGGIKKTGSLRGVKIFRQGATIPVDLYDFVRGSADAETLSLTNGDRVYVPVIGNTVAVSGQAKRPGIYELPEGSSAIGTADLIELAGGVWVRGDYRYAVLRVQPDGTERLVDLRQPSADPVQSGEILFAEPAKDVTIGTVTLGGHARLPGPYPVSTAGTVRALLRGYEGLLPDPYLPFAVMETPDPRTRAGRFEKFDLGAALSGRRDVRLSTDDRVFVLGLEHVKFLSSTGVINAIQGRATNPGEQCAGLDFLARWVLANPNSDLASGQFATALKGLVGPQAPSIATMERGIAGGQRTCPELFDQNPGLLTFVLQNSIIVRGNVLNPGAYPVAGPDGVDQVMDLARVLSGDRRSSVQAVGATAELNRMAAERGAAVVESTEPAQRPTLVRRAGVAEIVEVEEARVRLTGHVRFPGSRSLASARTVRDLIGDDGQFLENPYLLYGVILRRNPRTLMREMIAFSPADALSGGDPVPLIDRDIVRVFGFDEVQTILREAFRPGFGNGQTGSGEYGTGTAADGPAGGRIGPGPGDATGLQGMTGMRGAAGPQNMTGMPGAAGQQGMTGVRDAGQQGMARMQGAPGMPGGTDGAYPPGALAGIVLPGGAGTHAPGAMPGQGFAGGTAGLTPSPGGMGGAGVATTGPEEGVLTFAALANLLSDASVQLLGEFVVPGHYPIVGEITLDRVISAAGGIAPRADVGAVEITRSVLDPGRNELEVERQLHDLRLVQASAIRITAGTVVLVNPLISQQEIGLVEVRGEVKRPGRYGIVRGEKLSSLLERAGGLQALAYPAGTVFTRENVRQAEAASRNRAASEFHRALIGRLSEPASGQNALEPEQVDVMTDLLQRLQSEEAVGRMVVETNPIVLARRPELDVTLQGGDMIVVPRRPLSVFVSGEVFSAGAQQFSVSSSVSDYLDAAGGATEQADLSNAFIIRPNGSAERINLSVWGSSSNEVLPGSWIVVPRDLTPFRLREFATTFTQIFSQLAIGAASLAVISNSN